MKKGIKSEETDNVEVGVEETFGTEDDVTELDGDGEY